MKAQSMFGGTHPTDHSTKVRQVGHTGQVQNKTGSIERRDKVVQARPTPQSNTFNRKTKVRQVGSQGRNS